jgi:hypothetical protein
MKDLFEGVEFDDIHFTLFGKKMVAYAGGIGWWLIMIFGALFAVFSFMAFYILCCMFI